MKKFAISKLWILPMLSLVAVGAASVASQPVVHHAVTVATVSPLGVHSYT